jgi:hypothetical protein
MSLLFLILCVSFICLKHFLKLVNGCNFIFSFDQVVKPIYCLREWDESNQEKLNDEVRYKTSLKRIKTTTTTITTWPLGEKHCLLLLYWLS